MIITDKSNRKLHILKKYKLHYNKEKRELFFMNANKKRDFIVITVASLATFCGAYMGNVTPVALPKMAEIFGLSNIMQIGLQIYFY